MVNCHLQKHHCFLQMLTSSKSACFEAVLQDAWPDGWARDLGAQRCLLALQLHGKISGREPWNDGDWNEGSKMMQTHDANIGRLEANYIKIGNSPNLARFAKHLKHLAFSFFLFLFLFLVVSILHLSVTEARGTASAGRGSGSAPMPAVLSRSWRQKKNYQKIQNSNP